MWIHLDLLKLLYIYVAECLLLVAIALRQIQTSGCCLSAIVKAHLGVATGLQNN
jgi:hypothetical protein